jgi:protein gp37
MSDGSKIEWTDATWSPVTGCTKVSEGCLNCYIERTPPFRMARRKFDRPGVGGSTGVTLHSDRLAMPLGWRKPRRVFVNSLSDLFHDDVPDAFIAEVFAVMARCPQHVFQVLTKRHARMRSLLSSDLFETAVGAELVGMGMDGRAPIAPYSITRKVDSGLARPERWPLPNVWLGVSVETQQWADIRIPALLDTPAGVRWLSCEPLLGPVDLSRWLGPVAWPSCWDEHEPSAECSRCIRPEWVVVGGESGPGARPMNTQWAQQIVVDCRTAGVPVFVKQMGTRWGPRHHDINLFPPGLRIREYPQAVTE